MDSACDRRRGIRGDVRFHVALSCARGRICVAADSLRHRGAERTSGNPSCSVGAQPMSRGTALLSALLASDWLCVLDICADALKDVLVAALSFPSVDQVSGPEPLHDFAQARARYSKTPVAASEYAATGSDLRAYVP